MDTDKMSHMQKLTFSAMVMAAYIVVLYFTQSFSFGAYQIRIATSLYALAYIFPFLFFPLGFANLISNMLFGGFGVIDMAGGCIVGILTTAAAVLIRKKGWNQALVAVPIVLIPGLGVAVYLSYFLNMPYWLMAVNLCIGQLLPGIVGAVMVKALGRVWTPAKAAAGAAGCERK